MARCHGLEHGPLGTGLTVAAKVAQKRAARIWEAGVLGQRQIAGGIEASAQVVASGGAFLGDGDLVRVVEEPSAWDAMNRAEEAP